MIPRPIDYQTENHLFFLNDSATTFPPRIEMTGSNLTNEDAIRGSFYQLSRGSLANPMKQIGWTGQVSDDVGIRQISSPLSMKQYVKLQDTLPLQTMPNMASIPRNHISHALWRADSYSTGYGVTASALQPLVKTNCTIVEVPTIEDPSDTYLQIGDDSQELRNLISITDFERLSISNVSTTSDGSSSQTARYKQLWHEPPEGPVTHSLIFAESMDYNGTNGPWPSSGHTFDACTVDAYWVRSSLFFNSTAQVTEFEIEEDIYMNDSGVPISISLDWAQRLGKLWLEAVPNENLVFGVADSLAYILALGISDAVSKPALCGEWIASNLKPLNAIPDECLVQDKQQNDAISRFMRDVRFNSTYDGIFISEPTNQTDARQRYQLQIQSHKSGYGYDSSGVPVRLSLAVLATYCLIVVIYLTYTFITGRTASSWDSSSELIMLAMNSQKPTHLEGTSVGIETLSTFRESVSIRVNENDSVELVFENDPALKTRQLRAVVPNEAY
ncbi:MAG: hypothetical protein Q9160_001269 [Pyrenula sp. 1 TL-2023]